MAGKAAKVAVERCGKQPRYNERTARPFPPEPGRKTSEARLKAKKWERRVKMSRVSSSSGDLSRLLPDPKIPNSPAERLTHRGLV